MRIPGPIFPGVYVPTLMTALALGAYLRWSGLSRSLWVDEAWVANSVSEAELQQVFFYDGSLQTSPPVFLLLVRGVVALLGPSNETYRLVPFLLGLLGMLGFAFVLTSRLPRHYAFLGSMLLFFSPRAIHYSFTLKPYIGELAATVGLLFLLWRYTDNPSTRRYVTLTVMLLLSMPLGYATAFLAPGLALGIWLTPAQGRFGRAVVLSLVAGSIFVALNYIFIAPNVSPMLRDYWAVDSTSNGPFTLTLNALLSLHELSPGSERLGTMPWVWAPPLTLVILIGIGLAARHNRDHRPLSVVLVFSISPIVVWVGAGVLGFYPFTVRTSLFLLPLLILALLLGLWQIEGRLAAAHSRRGAMRRSFVVTVSLAALIAVPAGVRDSSVADRNHEEAEEAIRYLRAELRPGETLYVHATMVEAFKLYQRILCWHEVLPAFGDTGWPCCTRGAIQEGEASTTENVRSNLDTVLPQVLSGAVWVLHTGRDGHWRYVHLDEPAVIQTYLTEKGCREQAVTYFRNATVRRFTCP